MQKDYLKACPSASDPLYYVFEPDDTNLPSLDEAVRLIAAPINVEEDEDKG